MSLTRAAVVLLLALLLAAATIDADAGQRSNSCSFGYNNTFYIIGGAFANGTNFASTPLPINEGTINLWIPLPDPPGWTAMSAYTINTPPQFHCAVNRDGKVFLFGNTIGFAVFDITSGSWSTNPPTFQSGASMANLLNPYGISSAVFPDQYTIAIFSSSPPTYMELDSRTLTINGVAEPGFTTNFHGFCMDVIPTNPPTPVVCGGAIQPPYANQLYSADCWRFGLNSSITSNRFATMPSTQDGCSLLAFGSQFIVFPGYLSSYHSAMPVVSAANPDMYWYDMTSSTWSTVPNIQGTHYIPLVPYATAATMPGTNTAVLYGGVNPVSISMYGLIGIFDLQAKQWVNQVNRAANLPSSPPTPTPASQSNGKSNTGAIAGGIAGGIVALAASTGFILYRRKRSKLPPAQHSPGPSKSEIETLDEPPIFDRPNLPNPEPRSPHTSAYPLHSYTRNNPHAVLQTPQAVPSKNF